MSAASRRRADGTPHPVYVVHGDDAGLVSQELTALLAELGRDDASGLTPVEEYGEPGKDDDLVIGPVLDACRTPPFLADRRIIVIRDAGNLGVSQVKELVAYLNEPLDTTVLVVAVSGRSAPAALVKAVRSAGLVIDAAPAGTARARSQWFAEQLHGGPVRLDAAATARIEEHLGEDLARLEGILASMASAYGPGARIGLEQLEPFLGSAGGIAPWDLTDAIDRGDGAGAMAALTRLLGAGERHGLQVLATLHRHYGAMLRLDGADVADEAAAAALTGMSPYPAKKALLQTRRLGHERVARAITLLADADLDLRGRVGWSPELVLEVLVARLAQLARLPAGTGGVTAPRHRSSRQ
ncbi:MAG TPA: DNA polymerase III subunit delta [Acidimicrobiales bacterium]|nr:DNA polymerase III subunit delta [Acidimicrobiales bacterium]